MRGCGEFMPRSAMLYSNVTNAHDYALVDADSNASYMYGHCRCERHVQDAYA